MGVPSHYLSLIRTYLMYCLGSLEQTHRFLPDLGRIWADAHASRFIIIDRSMDHLIDCRVHRCHFCATGRVSVRYVRLKMYTSCVKSGSIELFVLASRKKTCNPGVLLKSEFHDFQSKIPGFLQNSTIFQ